MGATEQFDLVIVGGGMVGASLLCALLPDVSRYQLRVAIVEAFPLYAQRDTETRGSQKQEERSYQPSYDARSTALSWGSCNIFKRLGVWRELSRRVTPIEQIHVSDRGHFGTVRMKASEYDIDALGYVVENGWLGEVLLKPIQQSQEVSFLCPVVVTGVETAESGSRISIDQDGTERTIEAGLVVVADGGRSELSRQLNLEREQYDYSQHAIIANVTVQQPHQNVAYERFTQDGPLALLPLHEQNKRSDAQNRLALVLTVAREDESRLMAMGEGEFLTMLQEKFGYRLGRFEKVGERHSYPLLLQWVKDQVRPGIVVVGNAAHTLHPVAGQGFNLALRGVVELADTLHDAWERSEPVGSIATLQRYLDRRQRDQRRTIRFSDRMIRLFSNNDLLLSTLRDLGLLALDVIPPAKKLFVQQAMGFGHRLWPAGRSGR